MTAHFDDLETRDPAARESLLFERLPGFVAGAMARVPGLARWLDGVDPASLADRASLARLPVLRKNELMELQAAEPPFGGFADPGRWPARGSSSRRPGLGAAAPRSDPWQVARAFFAAGPAPATSSTMPSPIT